MTEVWKDADGNELDDREIMRRLLELTPREKRILSLMSAGFTDGRIATVVNVSPGTVKQDVNKKIKPTLGLSGRGREVVSLLYAAYLLPVDLLALNPHNRDYAAAGEKLADWTKIAEASRRKLRQEGVLTPRNIQLAALLANPEHADKNDEALAPLLPIPLGKKTLSAYTVKSCRWDMIGQLKSRSKIELAVAARLAPFDQQ